MFYWDEKSNNTTMETEELYDVTSHGLSLVALVLSKGPSRDGPRLAVANLFNYKDMFPSMYI